MQTIIVHYSEIAIKGANRNFFEQRLIENIKTALGSLAEKVYKRYGRVVCELKEGADKEKAKSILKNIPGIANFSFAVCAELSIEDIKNKAIELAKEKAFSTFKIETIRPNKQFNMSSMDINRLIGAEICKMGKKVDLKSPELVIHIEVTEKAAYIFTAKEAGVGGLPVGVSGKVVCSLSGGIDSPVAAFLAMKRGCKAILVHIANNLQASTATQEKIKDIAKELAKFQHNTRLYIVPFEKIQKSIIMNIHSKYRMIVYRRFMMRILNGIAKKENAKAIVTGDSIGQVASQTLENINSIYEAAELPVLAPLIGMNKEETVKIAKSIGTYSISIQPYPDCCSFMIAQHPATKSKIEEIKKLEKNIKQGKMMVNEAIKNSKIFVFNG